MTTVIVFLLVLSVLVLAHELGHFSAARKFKIKVEEFGLGFPPRAIGWYKNRFGKKKKVVGTRSYDSLLESENESLHPKKGSTIYSLNWLPLGGFVKIKGENGSNRNDPDSFGSKPAWQRAIVMAAGVAMNVLLAWILFSAGYMFGLPQVTDDLGPKAIVSGQSVMVADVLENSPAKEAGFMSGDKILAVDGTEINHDTSLSDLVAKNPEIEKNVLLERDGEELSLTLVPMMQDDKPILGVSIFSAGTVRYPVFYAFIEGAKTTAWTLKEIVLAFGGLFRDIFSGVKVGDQFAGPIGIANITGQAARLGFIYLLQFTALLSLNLAIINILPFPALDGGRLLFLLVEKLRGRPVKENLENLVNNIGFLLLMALILFITVKDVIKLF